VKFSTDLSLTSISPLGEILEQEIIPKNRINKKINFFIFYKIEKTNLRKKCTIEKMINNIN
jgi:hypothetical protein